MTYAGGVKTPARPTREEMQTFLRCLSQVPPKYLGSCQDNRSPEYGTLYTAVYHVRDWLRYEFIDRPATQVPEPARSLLQDVLKAWRQLFR